MLAGRSKLALADSIAWGEPKSVHEINDKIVYSLAIKVATYHATGEKVLMHLLFPARNGCQGENTKGFIRVAKLVVVNLGGVSLLPGRLRSISKVGLLPGPTYRHKRRKPSEDGLINNRSVESTMSSVDLSIVGMV